MGEIGPHRRCRSVTGVQHRAVGQHDLEADDHLVDLAVARAVLPGAPAGHPSTDGGDVEALRKVADGHRAPLAQFGLEVGPERARPDLDHTRHGVDVDDALHRREIEHHATERRYRRP